MKNKNGESSFQDNYWSSRKIKNTNTLGYCWLIVKEKKNYTLIWLIFKNKINVNIAF